jgi:hypothetical protein
VKREKEMSRREKGKDRQREIKDERCKKTKGYPEM